MNSQSFKLDARLQKRGLVIEDDELTRHALARELEKLGFSVDSAEDLGKASDSLAKITYDLVLSDIHLPDGNALDLKLSLARESSSRRTGEQWVFISGDPNPDLLQRVIQCGGFDLLRKPFSRSDLRSLLEKIALRERDPVKDITALIEEISGIRLGDQKKRLVEGRLHQRARELSLHELNDYLAYFRTHRHEELKELLSLVSTHTTHFFREPDHFDFLCKTALPKLLQQNRPLRIWSAACSSGEEVYSIAMLIHSMFLLPAQENPTRKRPLQIELIGTDLDSRSVERAINGVYPYKTLTQIPSNFAQAYVERGKSELSDWMRIRNDLHQLCRFRSANLLSTEWPVRTADIIFLRNALMYFAPELALQVVERAKSILPEDGYLFLGHSEAGLGLKAGLKLVAPAVYVKTSKKRG